MKRDVRGSGWTASPWRRLAGSLLTKLKAFLERRSGSIFEKMFCATSVMTALYKYIRLSNIFVRLYTNNFYVKSLFTIIAGLTSYLFARLYLEISSVWKNWVGAEAWKCFVVYYSRSVKQVVVWLCSPTRLILRTPRWKQENHRKKITEKPLGNEGNFFTMALCKICSHIYRKYATVGGLRVISSTMWGHLT